MRHAQVGHSSTLSTPPYCARSPSRKESTVHSPLLWLNSARSKGMTSGCTKEVSVQRREGSDHTSRERLAPARHLAR